MEKNYVGQCLKNQDKEEYVVLSQIKYKNVLCVYAVKNTSEKEEADKKFFQVSDGNETHLVSIESKKMLQGLHDIMFKENVKEDKPRKIMENESITDYFAYLDDYYKTKVNTIL